MCVVVGSKPSSTTSPEPSTPDSPSLGDYKLAKNKSTTNLLSQSNPSLSVNTVRPRMSFDAGSMRDYDRLTRLVPRRACVLRR